MSKHAPSRRRLAAIAAAGLLSVALPAAPAFAEKIKNKAPVATEAPASVTEFSLDIPGIDSVGSNLDDSVLRDIIGGNIAGHADELAGLTATSISIPTITLLATITTGDKVRETEVTFTDVALKDVKDGVAGSISLGSASIDAGDEGGADIGAMSANNFDIGGVLGLYGLVTTTASTELKTVYTDLSVEGGAVDTPELSCTIGSASVAELKARPLGYNYGEVLALVSSMHDESTMKPEDIGKLVRLYADFLTAFESTPIQFDGFDCEGVDNDDRAMSFSVASMTSSGMSPGIYPGLTLEGIDINVEGDGAFSIGKFDFKPMDMSGPLAVLKAAPAALDAAWFEDNARLLFPAFKGLSFEALAIDVPDPDVEDARIVANVGKFDLTLDNYRNGIPTDLHTSASDIVVDLPKSEDAQLKQLAALGLTSVNAGFTVAANWNEADQSIVISEASINAVDLGSIALAGTIINATDALFSLDENEALMASFGLAIRNVKADATDAGLSDLILKVASAEQGTDPATMRPIFAGLAEGTVIGFLAGAAEAQKVGSAISAFISGKAKNLTIEMTAKDPAGLSLPDFVAAEEDPTALIGKVTIDASAK